MRHALIWGAVASFILTAGLLLATAKHNPVGSAVAGGIPSILAELPSWLQDCTLVLIIFAFFSCGSSIQGAGSRLAFSYARDGALPGSSWISRVNKRFKTPANALLMGAVITVLFALLVYINPGSNYHIWFVTYPAHVNALVALVSFGVSGIYLSFLLTVIGAIIARARGWEAEGAFRLGKWAWPVLIVAGAYLAAMFVNVIYPSGLSSARAYVNLDWITLFIIFIIAVVGGLYLLIGRPDRNVEQHLHDPLEPTGAERHAGAAAGGVTAT
jgi:amino acid transporter